jgi:hypothetical protein
MDTQTSTRESIETEPTYEKVSDTQIKVSKTVTTTIIEPVVETLDFDFLLKQEEAIKAQRAAIRENLAQQSAENDELETAEIADVKARLAVCIAQELKTSAQVAQEVAALQANEKPIGE